MKNTYISVIMPTYNSGKTIGRSLLSIRNQTFPQTNIEILVIDGGSTDETHSVAKKFNCVILDNKKRLPEFAKHIGITNAKGDYCVFLDSDEVLTNKQSFQMKYDIVEKNKDVKNILIGGLKTPSNFPFISEYASSIGDPFSYFMYGIDAVDYIKSLEKKYASITKKDTYCIYNVDTETLPICDGGGHFFDLLYLKQNFSVSDQKIISTIFDQMVGRTKKFAVVKDDYVMHYATDSVQKYVKKLQWRIVGNVNARAQTVTGFSDRESALPLSFRMKKFLFLPLSVSLLWPLYSAIILSVKKNNMHYMLHLLFSFYTAILIVFYYVLRVLGIQKKLSVYGA